MLTPEISHRLLVVADESCTAPGLCASVRTHANKRRLEVLVLSPAEGAAATQWYADEDAARAEATRRLRECISCLHRQGVDARGELAGPEPLQAIVDAIKVFPADEIVIVTAPRRPSAWLQRGVIDQARETLPQPITHVFIPATPERSRG